MAFDYATKLVNKQNPTSLRFDLVGVKLDTSKFTTLINIINEDYALEKEGDNFGMAALNDHCHMGHVRCAFHGFSV
ncbi:hypothetical protein MTR_6g071185 [Medicago truncatula]|uniref:Uncharacterized protein n=1 Tax=Medicago truncatula TaxID=3880 RepID=A0A072UCE7_MEDTR|nr:hypothetical protein MTR_6g071185 [Medicago truncatula]